MRNVCMYLLKTIFAITIFIAYIIHGKISVSEKLVNIEKIESREIEKEKFTGEYMEIMIKNSSDLSSCLKQYNIPDLTHEVNWDKEFVLVTYPYEINKCTYSLANDKGNFHVLDIIYSKARSTDLNIYVVRGNNFITWEAAGVNKDIGFEWNFPEKA